MTRWLVFTIVITGHEYCAVQYLTWLREKAEQQPRRSRAHTLLVSFHCGAQRSGHTNGVCFFIARLTVWPVLDYGSPRVECEYRASHQNIWLKFVLSDHEKLTNVDSMVGQRRRRWSNI